MTQPHFKLWKTYLATVVAPEGKLAERILDALSDGVDIGENGAELITRPAKVEHRSGTMIHVVVR